MAGAVAVAVAIAVGEILAGLVAGAPSLVVAVGSLVVDLQPPGAKDFVVSLFGTNDKLALNIVILVVALAVGGDSGSSPGRIRRPRWPDSACSARSPCSRRSGWRTFSARPVGDRPWDSRSARRS